MIETSVKFFDENWKEVTIALDGEFVVEIKADDDRIVSHTVFIRSKEGGSAKKRRARNAALRKGEK